MPEYRLQLEALRGLQAEFPDAQPSSGHTRAEARVELPPEGGTLTALWPPPLRLRLPDPLTRHPCADTLTRPAYSMPDA